MKGLKRLFALIVIASLITLVPILVTQVYSWEASGSMGSAESSTRQNIESYGTRGAAGSGIEHDVPAETQAVEAGGTTRGTGSVVGSEGYGSAPGFPAGTGRGNIPPFNAPADTTTTDTSTMRGTAAPTDATTGTMQRGAGARTDSMMMQSAPATTDPTKQAYQSGYKDGFTDGFKSADTQHGTRGAARGDMSMRGAEAPSSVSNDYREGYRSGFWEGFSSATAEHAPMAPGATRGDTSLQQQPSDSMMQQDSSMMNGSMRGGADLEGGNTQLDTVNGTTRGGATQQDSSMMNDSMRGTTDSSSGAAQGSSY